MYRPLPWHLQLADGPLDPQPHKLPLPIAALKYEIGTLGGFYDGGAAQVSIGSRGRVWRRDRSMLAEPDRV